jgi:mannose-6-phosphate isomerase
MGVVSGGPLDGKTFRELLEDHAKELLGEGKGEDFPLLIKVLDAAKTLSVQVHPNDETAGKYGGEAKTECWYILQADEGACVYCGLKEGVTPEQFRTAIEEGEVEACLTRLPVTAGDLVFVPGGRMHAIASGCLLLEVQQNSNTTYRVYDWGRVGTDGRPRELHIEQALQVTNWGEAAAGLTPAQPLPPLAGMSRELLVESPYFRLESVEAGAEEVLPACPQGFQVLFVTRGTLVVTANGETVQVPEGSSVLLPAATGEAALTGPARLVRITQPD